MSRPSVTCMNRTAAPRSSGRAICMVAMAVLLAAACAVTPANLTASSTPAAAEPTAVAAPIPTAAHVTEPTESTVSSLGDEESPETPGPEDRTAADEVAGDDTEPVDTEPDDTEPDDSDWTTEVYRGEKEAVQIEHDPSWRFDGTLTRDQMVSVLSTTLGPTDDFAAALARISHVNHRVPTLPDTEIVRLIINNQRWFNDDETIETLTDLSFVTSASLEEAEQIYLTELVNLGWEVTQEPVTHTQAERDAGDMDPHLTARPPSGDHYERGAEIFLMDRVGGGTIVIFRYEGTLPEGQTSIDAGDSWHRPGPIPDRAEFASFSAWAWPAQDGEHRIDISSQFVGEQLEIVGADVNLWSRETGHQAVEQDGLILTGYLGHNTAVEYYPDSEDPIDGGFDLRIMQTSIVATDVDSPLVLVVPLETAEEPDDDLPAAPPEPSFIELSEPNGPQIRTGLDAAGLVTAIQGLLVATDDVGSTTARLAPFPAAVPTLSDARVTGLTVALDPHNGHTTTQVFYNTSASVTGAGRAHTDALVDTGWTLTSTTTEGDPSSEDAEVHLMFEQTDPQTRYPATLSVHIDVRYGGTSVGVYFTSRDEIGPALFDRLTDWYDTESLGGGEIRQVWIRVDGAFETDTSVQMNADVQFIDSTVDEIAPIVVEAFAAHPEWSSIDVDAEREPDGGEQLFAGTFEPFDGEAELTVGPDDREPRSVNVEARIFAIVPVG